jgi:hypothetical protein
MFPWGGRTTRSYADSMKYEVELHEGNIMYIGYMEDGTVFGCAYGKN